MTAVIDSTEEEAVQACARPPRVQQLLYTRVLIDQVRTIDISYVTGEIVDYLTQDDMAQVEHGPLRYVGLLR